MCGTFLHLKSSLQAFPAQDLGPVLPNTELPVEAVSTHQENLRVVQQVMFGNRPSKPLTPNAESALDSFLVNSGDIQHWLSFTESHSESYQRSLASTFGYGHNV